MIILISYKVKTKAKSTKWDQNGYFILLYVLVISYLLKIEIIHRQDLEVINKKDYMESKIIKSTKLP